MAENQFSCGLSAAKKIVSERQSTIATSTTNTQPKKSNISLNSSSSAVLNSAITKISTLFFDLDNTLIPTRSGDAKACRKLSEVLENQYSFHKEESTSSTQAFLKSFRRCPDNSQTSLDSWRTYLWREALPVKHKHLAEEIYSRWLKLRYRQLALPAEYVSLLRGFRERGYRLALITNGPSNAQWEKIRKLSVSQYFDCVLVSSDLPWEKPHPNIFFAACNFLGVKPNKCVMIGDKLETDIKGAGLAGLAASFWIPLNASECISDFTDVEYPPNYVLKNVVELRKYFVLNGAGTSSGGSSCSTTNMTTTSTAATTQSKLRRSSQQFNCNTTTSTCYQNDHHPHPYLQSQSQQQQQQQQQRYPAQQQEQIQKTSTKYRRGGSLPPMDCSNSETENSCDGMFF